MTTQRPQTARRALIRAELIARQVESAESDAAESALADEREALAAAGYCEPAPTLFRHSEMFADYPGAYSQAWESL